MKNSTFKPRTSPLQRVTFKPGKSLRGSTRMKTSKPKMSSIRKSARGEQCTINLSGVCNGDPQTVVWCHENSYAAGKGMGLKARDEFGAYGCHACHMVYDGQHKRPAWLSEEEVDFRFEQAKAASLEILKTKGLVK